MKVIGAGFGRTGTASLQSALGELGFGPCYHMFEVLSNPGHAGFWEAAWRGKPADWDGVLGSYEATVDWPACTFYAELMERHPDAPELVRDLHEANPSVPVLVMTSIEEREVHERFLQAGASEILDKEGGLAEILAAVRRLGGEEE